jgi:hypothetical protein
MIHVYRITNGPEVGDLVDSIEALEAFAREHGPWRYNVDEHSLAVATGQDRERIAGHDGARLFPSSAATRVIDRLCDAFASHCASCVNS